MACKVMVVDDEESMRDVMAALLELEGYDSVCFETANNIVEHVVEEHPTCLILDVFIGDGPNGEEALQLLVDAGVSLPVILYSSKDPGADQTTLREYAAMIGAYDYIAKPFDIDDVITSVKKYC